MTIKAGRVALVTGAGSGIGRGIALEFARQKIKVVVCDINPDNAARVCQEIQDLGGEAIVVVGDVGCAADSQKMVQAALDKWGQLDILINNAGILRDAFMRDMTEKQWDQVQSVIGKGTFLCMQAALKPMTEQKYGRIVNLSSGAHLGNKGQANYSAAKAGVVALTKVAALELAEHNITVNCIAPGLINTPMTSGLPEKILQRLAKNIPAGFIGEPEDIAYLVMALVGEEARYITGQTIHVDGGATVGIRM